MISITNKLMFTDVEAALGGSPGYWEDRFYLCLSSLHKKVTEPKTWKQQLSEVAQYHAAKDWTMWFIIFIPLYCKPFKNYVLVLSGCRSFSGVNDMWVENLTPMSNLHYNIHDMHFMDLPLIDQHSFNSNPFKCRMVNTIFFDNPNDGSTVIHKKLRMTRNNVGMPCRLYLGEEEFLNICPSMNLKSFQSKHLARCHAMRYTILKVMEGVYCAAMNVVDEIQWEVEFSLPYDSDDERFLRYNDIFKDLGPFPESEEDDE